MTRDFSARVRVVHLLFTALAALLVQAALMLDVPAMGRWMAILGDPAVLIVLGGTAAWIACRRGLAGPSLDAMPGALLWIDRACRVCGFNQDAAHTFPWLKHGEILCARLDDEGSQRLRAQIRSNVPTGTEFEASSAGRRLRIFIGARFGRTSWRFVQVTDITEFRAMSERIALSEERLRRLFEATDEGLILLDVQGRVEASNPAGRRMLNLEPLDTGMRLDDCLPADVVAAAHRVSVAAAGMHQRFGQVTLHQGTGHTLIAEIRLGSLGLSTDAGAFVLLRDVTEQRRYETQLRESREELRSLNNAMERIREEERSRIARDLHDDLGQILTAMKMDIARSLESEGSLVEPELTRLHEMQHLIDNAIKQVREIASNLRPGMLDDLGFEAAAEWFLNRCRARYAVSIEFEVAPGVSEKAQGDVATALYRILQECMTNVVRHACATKVQVNYDEQDGLATLVVNDNGRGFDLAGKRNPGLGVLGMKERAALLGGSVVLESAPGQGTRVMVHIPLDNCA